jgi:hypothetical protein
VAVVECKIIDLTTQKMNLEEGYPHKNPKKITKGKAIFNDYHGEGNLTFKHKILKLKQK